MGTPVVDRGLLGIQMCEGSLQNYQRKELMMYHVVRNSSLLPCQKMSSYFRARKIHRCHFFYPVMLLSSCRVVQDDSMDGRLVSDVNGQWWLTTKVVCHDSKRV